jgi:hypothetical protein
MGKRVISFGDFILLKESANPIETGFPAKWKRLQELGFYDASTPRVKANGNILLKNDKFNYYPAGIVLQIGSGYVRDKAARSGFIKKDLNLDQMVDYLIQRFEKLEAGTSADLSPEAVTLLRKISKSKATKNPGTGRFDFTGSIDLGRDSLDSLKSLGIKLGAVGKNFDYIGSNSFLSLEDLEFFPTEVKEEFMIRNCRFQGFSDFSPFPTKMGNGLVVQSVENLKSLSGTSLNSGKKTEIKVYYCWDLESLGDDLPEEVKEINLIPHSAGNTKLPLSSLKGSPKIVREDFYVQYTSIRSFEGGPEKIGRRCSLSGNSLLTSLRGFPIDFDGTLVSDIIECWFSLEDRMRIITEGIYSPSSWSGTRSREIVRATPFQREFVATSLPIDYVQDLIDQNPEKMAIVLKGVIKDPYFKGLKWPESLKGEVDLLSDLEDIGL